MLVVSSRYCGGTSSLLELLVSVLDEVVVVIMVLEICKCYVNSVALLERWTHVVVSSGYCGGTSSLLVLVDVVVL